MRRKAKKTSLHDRLTKSLTPRILTAIMVIFLPVCFLSIFTAGIVVTRSAEQIVESFERELDLDMKRLEQNMKVVETDMDRFVSMYLSELSSKGTYVNDAANMDMLKELDQILEHTSLPGYLYLYDLSTGKIYIKYQGLPYTTLQQEMQKENLELIAQSIEIVNYEQMRLNREDYMVRSYSYLNYRAGFLFHLSDSISGQLADHYQDGTIYYLGKNPMVLKADGIIEEAKQDWETLTRSTLGKRLVEWKSEELPLNVCLQFSNSIAWKMIPGVNWILLVMALLCVLLVPFMWSVLKKEVIFPLGILVHGMQELGKNDLSYRIRDNKRENSMEIQYLYNSFDKMAAEIEQSKEKDIKMVKAELDNLRLQVNPHMLLNSFNMIYSLAQSKNYTCIQDFTMHLVEYFRYVLRKNDDFVTVKKELEFIENYKEMQKIRFPNAFTCVYNIDEACLGAQIPPLLIENFMENSMKYAMIPGQTIEVLLNVRREGEQLLISVIDTGRGIRPEILEEIKKGKPYIDKNGNKHIGIWNCMRRVEAFYGEKAKLSIVSTRDEGTQIFLAIPYKEEAKDEVIDRG